MDFKEQLRKLQLQEKQVLEESRDKEKRLQEDKLAQSEADRNRTDEITKKLLTLAKTELAPVLQEVQNHYLLGKGDLGEKTVDWTFIKQGWLPLAGIVLSWPDPEPYTKHEIALFLDQRNKIYLNFGKSEKFYYESRQAHGMLGIADRISTVDYSNKPYLINPISLITSNNWENAVESRILQGLRNGETKYRTGEEPRWSYD
jgi:hypothetical protein